MIVRRDHLDALSRHKRAEYLKELARLLSDALPEHFYDKSDEEVQAVASKWADEARGYGIDMQDDTANYVQMRVEAGEAFDRALKTDADFRAALENPELRPARKLDLISQKFFSLE